MKTAVVIGVGPQRVLGATLCRAAAARGQHVVIAGRSMDKLQAIAESIESAGGAASPAVFSAKQRERLVYTGQP